MNKEFLKMQKMSSLITESEYKEKINEEVYKSNPYNELYKIKNFPKGDLQTPAVKDILSKIYTDAYGDDIEEVLDDNFWTKEVNSYLKRLPSTDVVYIHTDGEGRFSIVNTLKKFSDGYKTEEDWGVESWDKI